MALAAQRVSLSETQFLGEPYHFTHSPPTPVYTPELVDAVQSLYQIQHISATIADLAKSAQLNANDPNYVLRVRSEIAQLSSLLISYSLSSELRAPKPEPKEEVRAPSCSASVAGGGGAETTHKRKHKAIATQNLYCRSCGTTQTPEWRRGPDGGKSLCNACGLHYAKIIKREVLVPARKTETTAQAMNLRTLLN